MPKLKTILVVHTTSTATSADSSAKFALQIFKASGETGASVSEDLTPNLLKPSTPSGQPPPPDRRPGEMDLYKVDVSGKNIDSDAEGFRIKMKMKDTDDAWLPQSIFVLGHTETGQIVLLGYHPQWGIDKSRDPKKSKWFDRPGSSASQLVGPDTHLISS